MYKNSEYKKTYLQELCQNPFPKPQIPRFSRVRAGARARPRSSLVHLLVGFFVGVVVDDGVVLIWLRRFLFGVRCDERTMAYPARAAADVVDADRDVALNDHRDSAVCRARDALVRREPLVRLPARVLDHPVTVDDASWRQARCTTPRAG